MSWADNKTVVARLDAAIEWHERYRNAMLFMHDAQWNPENAKVSGMQSAAILQILYAIRSEPVQRVPGEGWPP